MLYTVWNDVVHIFAKLELYFEFQYTIDIISYVPSKSDIFFIWMNTVQIFWAAFSHKDERRQ